MTLARYRRCNNDLEVGVEAGSVLGAILAARDGNQVINLTVEDALWWNMIGMTAGRSTIDARLLP
jgi:hypothetical protein